jgi:transposase
MVSIPACKESKINCIGFISRKNDFKYRTTTESVNSDFVIETLDQWSLQLNKPTVIVLDNARIHTARKVKQLLQIWQQRGLYIFYLPPYSPHLNIIERLWKEIKEGWLKPTDYQSSDKLFYAVNRICSNIGKNLFLKFAKFNYK